MTSKELIQKLQLAIGVTPDGVFGPVTEAMTLKFDIDVLATEKEAVVNPGQPGLPVSVGNYFGAIWIGSYLDFLGLEESSPKLNAALVPEWAKENLPHFKTLAGNDHPWCSVLVNASFRKVGIKPTNNAMASSWRTWGRKGEYWFGSVLGLRHASGGGHVTFFLYWVDKAKGLAACYGGNQSNHLSVVIYNLSGNAHGHEEVVNGPRWPEGQPDGKSLTQHEVLSQYPNLKVGGVAGSTR